MRNLFFVLLVVIPGAPALEQNLFVARIQRCTVEDFMVQHRMLYHVTLSRSDTLSLNLLCKKQSEVQTDLSMR